MKRITPLLFALASLLVSGCGPSLDDPNQVHLPSVQMSKVAGTYIHSDGVRMLKIEEVYETGWNGKLSFSPAIGDWTVTPRCRVSDFDLAVEFPISGKPVIMLFAHIDGPGKLTTDAPPWEGSYTRIR